ncbi:MAG: hypothetical protein ACK5P1_06300, partial [Sphingobacteriia bacterium]
LKEKKVVWGEWGNEDIFIISVDGVHCRIQEVRKEPSAKWFDHKSHGAGVAYELGIAIRSGIHLLWLLLLPLDQNPSLSAKIHLAALMLHD